jgi:PAS domain S-box-containing protein
MVSPSTTASQDAVDLESVLATAELSRRPSRHPDYAAENRALVALAQQMAASPGGILQKLVETALELCRAHSAGISLLEEDGKQFYWPAIVGQWATHVGGGTPRDYGPSGTVLDRNVAQLFSHPERYFTYLASVTPGIEEALLIPFYVDGKAVGTIWVIAHDESVRFDAEDLRVMTNLGTFAASAYQMLGDTTERRQAEERSARLAEELQLLTDAVPALVSYVDAEGRYRFNNNGYVEWFGHQREEIHGKHLRDVLGEAAYERIRPHVEAALAGRRVHYADEVPYKEGGTRFIHADYVPHIKPSGAVAGFYALVTDITERRRIEEALRARLHETESVYELSQAVGRAATVEQVYDAALDALSSTLDAPRAAILLFDADGVMRFKAWRGLSEGYRQAVEGHSPWSPADNDPQPFGVADVAVDPSLAPFKETIHREGIHALAFIPLLFEQRLLGKLMVYFDQPRALTAEEWHPVQTIANQIAFAIARRQAEAALRESEARFRVLADHAPVLIWVNSPTGCEFVNRSYLDFLGVALEEVQGMGWARFVHPDDCDRYVSGYLAASGKRATFEGELRFRRADGVYRIMKTVALPRLSAAGDFLGYVGCTYDVTDVKEADRRKDEFLAMLAHELRNPLAPILNAVQIHSMLDASDPRLPKQREVIKRQVEQMKHLLDDLLDVSRITRDKIQLRRERLQLAAVLGEAVDTSRPLLQAKAHRLSVTLPAETVWIHADPTRIVQVFTNLLNNAAKYTDPGGQIWLSAELAGDEVHVRVRDNGIGMAPDVLAHVFNLFAQADRSLDRSQGGLGIGLTIVRRLVEMHGGDVRAESAGPGKGSEFVVRLPV